jgi:hypothetical protein
VPIKNREDPMDDNEIMDEDDEDSKERDQTF